MASHEDHISLSPPMTRALEYAHLGRIYFAQALFSPRIASPAPSSWHTRTSDTTLPTMNSIRARSSRLSDKMGYNAAPTRPTPIVRVLPRPFDVGFVNAVRPLFFMWATHTESRTARHATRSEETYSASAHVPPHAASRTDLQAASSYTPLKPPSSSSTSRDPDPQEYGSTMFYNSLHNSSAPPPPFTGDRHPLTSNAISGTGFQPFGRERRAVNFPEFNVTSLVLNQHPFSSPNLSTSPILASSLDHGNNDTFFNHLSPPVTRQNGFVKVRYQRDQPGATATR
ncbi:hypothetical protein LXA43DRAFT_1098152 [Ganoderma leucocontextum]|nr:hypothetical protein LXA43DRAFT_1098152 [Ganoderma leucocontextum]